MDRLRRMLLGLLALPVLMCSRALSILSGGSRYEDFSPRCYLKSSRGNPFWLRSMWYVDFIFTHIPEWTEARSENHCRDAAQKAARRAQAVIDEFEEARIAHFFINRPSESARDTAEVRARRAGL